MNQKYLKGYASDMTKEDQENGIVFLALPQNIAAFIQTHRRASQVRIGTLDGKTFLTVRGGLIDTCPDQKYLFTVLLPTLVLMQQGLREIPELVRADAQAQDYQCPMPDWNYARWDGIEDEAYSRWKAAGLLEEEGMETRPEQLLHYKRFGKNYSMQLTFQMYAEGNLGIEMIRWRGDDSEPWGMLTVNLDGKRQKDCAFIDTNNHGQEILEWIEKNGMGHVAGRTGQSGFCTYPEVQFNSEFLKELNPRAYEVYAKQFSDPQRTPKRGKSDTAR